MFDYNNDRLEFSETISKSKDQLYLIFIENKNKKLIKIPLYLQSNREEEVFTF